MPSSYIDDGYTESGLIRGGGKFVDIAFNYRPMTAREAAAFWKKSQKLDEEKALDATIEVLAAKLTDWSVTDSAGKPVPITTATLQQMRPAIIGSLFDAVYGPTSEELRKN